MIDVVAALISDGSSNEPRYLIARRHRARERGLLWEFPGGKVESGETFRYALKREILEELEIRVDPGPLLVVTLQSYEDLTVRLWTFAARADTTEVRPREHEDVRWVSAHEMSRYDFSLADLPTVRLVGHRNSTGREGG